MRFSSPITTSRFRRPMSASIETTRWPRMAKATLTFAVAVVLPTPPLPDVMVITFALMCLSPFPSGMPFEYFQRSATS